MPLQPRRSVFTYGLPKPVDVAAFNHPLVKDRVGWWMSVPGRVGDGKYLQDLSIYGYTGTMNKFFEGTTTGYRATDRPGGYGHIKFDGTNDYIDCGFNPAWNTSFITVAAWIRFNFAAIGLNKGFISRDDTVVPRIWHFRKGTLEKVEWVYFFGGGSTQTATGATVLSAVTWYYLMVTQDTHQIVIYLNGEPDSVTVTNVTLDTGFKNLFIGALTTAGLFDWNGDIDDCGIWNRALTPLEAKQQYNLSRSGYPGLLRRKSPWIWTQPAAAPPVGGETPLFLEAYQGESATPSLVTATEFPNLIGVYPH